ncbi:MAG: alpha amylase catalytic region [Mucilaginibacter sp.]|nr:alpha amylase catalytic region [Mucilaginibacter sp.]
MFSSLFSPEVKNILADAQQSAGAANGPFQSPGDWRDQLIYFIMVDRFNNPLAAPVHAPFDDPTFNGYQGGKFAGIKQQLAYIKSLGAGAIWLSPVLKNLVWNDGSYHGYGIHDFLRAEPKFASPGADPDDELRALVDAAHAEGLYVIFDIVLNHTGDVFSYFGQSQWGYSDSVMPVQWRDAAGNSVPADADVALIQNPSPDALVWPSELQNNNYFRRQGMTGGNSDDTIGDFDSLKQFISADPDVQRFLIRAYQYVIARYDVDGFRIDTLRFLKGNLAQLFGNSIREFALTIGKKNFFTFGEVLGGGDMNTVIANFIGRNTQTGSDMDSMVGVDAALDYPLFFTVTGVLKGMAPPSALVGVYAQRKAAEQFILSSHGDASRYFVTFLDNHDMKARFRWEQPGNPTEFDDQVSLAFACLYCLPGIPALYYGIEQGLHGGDGQNDASVREALWGLFPAFPQNSKFYVELQQIASVRNAQPALRYGRFYFRPVSGDSFNFGISGLAGGILAWSRIVNDQEVLIVANTNTTQTIAVDVIMEISLSTDGQPVNVLYSNKAVFTAPLPVKNRAQAAITESDGSSGSGPINTTRVALLPMEVQLLKC